MPVLLNFSLMNKSDILKIKVAGYCVILKFKLLAMCWMMEEWLLLLSERSYRIYYLFII